jgi:hypothetical protein
LRIANSAPGKAPDVCHPSPNSDVVVVVVADDAEMGFAMADYGDDYG